MLDIGLNIPHLTDEGARVLGERATENLVKIVPSQTTTLLIAGGLFLLGTGWLALAFYRELHKGGITRHTVEHHSHTSTPHTQG
jgi:hypothetical protein